MIPYEEWTLDYSKPHLYCTTKDGKCTTVEFDIPKDAKIQVLQNVDGEPRPGYLIDPNVKVKYLKHGTNKIGIKGDFSGLCICFIVPW